MKSEGYQIKIFKEETRMKKSKKTYIRKNIKVSVKKDWDSSDLFEEILIKFKLKKFDIELAVSDDGVDITVFFRKMIEIGSIHISEMTVNWILEQVTKNKKYKPSWKEIIRLFKK